MPTSADEAPLRADAITAEPLPGLRVAAPRPRPAVGTGRGVFVLALTSNPEGAAVQHAGGAGGSVAGGIVHGVREDNAGQPATASSGASAWWSAPPWARRCSTSGSTWPTPMPRCWRPASGAQGGTADDLRRVFGAALPNVLASEQPRDPRRRPRRRRPAGAGPAHRPEPARDPPIARRGRLAPRVPGHRGAGGQRAARVSARSQRRAEMRWWRPCPGGGTVPDIARVQSQSPVLRHRVRPS